MACLCRHQVSVILIVRLVAQFWYDIQCRQPDILVNVSANLRDLGRLTLTTDRRRSVRVVTFTKHEQPLPDVYWSGTEQS
jgi:hypothetical protein